MMHIKRILGPPGTGKTTELIRRVEQYLEKRIAPEQIAFVSYTRAAAYEARDRALAKFGDMYGKDRFPHFRTLHSMASRALELDKNGFILTRHYQEIGNIVGFKTDTLTGNPVDPARVQDRDTTRGNRALQIISAATSAGLSLNDYVRRLPEYVRLAALDGEGALVKKLDRVLREFKADTGLRDYNDIMVEAAQEGAPALHGVEVAIIDEAQDLSEIQWNAALNLFREVPLLVVVGDDDQAIYEWNGASVDRFLNLPVSVPDETLQRSYRLPRAVYEKAVEMSDLIRNPARLQKQWTHNGTEGQVDYIADCCDIKLLHEGEWFVLARNRFALQDFMVWAKQKGLPVAGIVDAEQERAIRGVSALHHGRKISGKQVLAIASIMKSGPGKIRRGGKKLIQETIEENTDYSFQQLRDGFGFDFDPSKEWWENLPKISDGVVTYCRNVHAAGESLKNPRIIADTIHSVKGRECDNVMLLDDMARQTHTAFTSGKDRYHDEECRVFYVGASRAKKRLVIASGGGNLKFQALRGLKSGCSSNRNKANSRTRCHKNDKGLEK